MIFLLILLDTCNDSRCPFNDQILQAISLVQISVHELLHGLPWQMTFFALLVKLGLLGIDVINEIAKLAQRQCASVCLGDSSSGSPLLAKESRPSHWFAGTSRAAR